MAGLSQNLKAVITFGGNIDSSWSRSANGLQKSLKDVGKQSEKLTKDQAKLAAEIKRAKLAGQSLGDLKRRYSDVSREIRKTEAEQQKLNQQMQKAQRLSAFKGAGKGLFRRGLGIAGQLGGMVAPGLAIGGGGVVASALGTLIAPAATNAETARRAGVAKSYGVDIPTFDAWDTLAKQYDMNGENIGDLFEEYLHKAGEYKQNGKLGSLQDAFETLGFKAGDFAGLSDMSQFEKIVERALSLQDESKASFALDSLFGGESSKLLMLLKQSGKSYRDLMDEQRRYNLVTKEGAEGAMEGNRAITNLRTVFSSAVAEISGQLGNELAPDVRRLTDDLAEWFKGGGIKRIVSFLRNDLYPGVLTFGQGIVFVGKVAYALAKKLSWLLPDERSDQRDVLKSLAMTGSVDIARMTAQRNGQGEWFEQQLKEKPDLLDDVKKSYRDTRGFFRDDEETFNTTLDKYLTPENSGGLFGPDGLMKPVQQPVTPGTGPTIWDNYPRTLLAPLPPETSPQVVLGITEQDTTRQTAVPRTVPLSGNADDDRGNVGTDAEGRWDMLLQKLDAADAAPTPRQLTDNRRFEYRFEIHGAPGQDERGIADEVEAVTKSSPAFTGNSSMLDGGQIW
ncbi:AAA family ATPase [Enterobacter adelaidei]